MLLAPSTLADETHNPFSGDPKAAKAGKFEFRINCAFCHGLGARGGGRGPDLTRSHKRHGDADADLFQNISQGIPGTVMPANGTNGQGVGMTDDEIWQIITYCAASKFSHRRSLLATLRMARNFFTVMPTVPRVTWSKAMEDASAPT
jgi:mono/diheme cytochrome c family protein